MGNRYIADISLTPTAGNDVMVLIPASGRRARLVQVVVTGDGTTSAAQKLLISRSSGGTTPGGAITPDKADHLQQPSASSAVDTTWSAQPTLVSSGVTLGWNALGGAIVYNVPKGMFEAVSNTDYISLRAPSGPTYQACSVSMVFEED